MKKTKFRTFPDSRVFRNLKPKKSTFASPDVDMQFGRRAFTDGWGQCA